MNLHIFKWTLYCFFLDTLVKRFYFVEKSVLKLSWSWSSEANENYTDGWSLSRGSPVFLWAQVLRWAGPQPSEQLLSAAVGRLRVLSPAEVGDTVWSRRKVVLWNWLGNVRHLVSREGNVTSPLGSHYHWEAFLCPFLPKNTSTIVVYKCVSMKVGVTFDPKSLGFLISQESKALLLALYHRTGPSHWVHCI